MLEVTARATARTGLEVGPLQVTGLVHGRRRLGAELGYTSGAERGPLLIASSFRAWHRSDRSTPIADVNHIDWGEPAVFLSPGARMTHPQAR